MQNIFDIVSGFRREEEAEAYAKAQPERKHAIVMNRGSEADPKWVVIEER